ncbi:glycosyltransferase family 4 protein [Thauera sp. CAU 1555]|uniref:Glycosyltransferase family 4 protein n=1 Tax=Thauera sedimentorum TaxID=2767595 RepID=A0ABR9BA84_9RHOO|nr:glycosyltransferase family 4 protein [Thauera sedimentorum]MBC9072301.1 glycosyltransferase family 4 protein [Thauera sedimentorum]MBD8503220.1 glycosyltransferase family 4 protein [Thauera sedimentorum]
MQLAFCLYKYFPFGGMQRNFLRIALACQARGHDIRVYVLEWQGEVPEGFELVRVPVRALVNHRRYRKFTDWVQADLARRPVDRVVGFNKMPGLDVYYAGDPCFEQKARALRGRFYRFSPRYRHFSAYERAVFDPTAHTRILMMSPVQKPMFVEHYGTPAHRFHQLPPGIARDRRAPPDAPAVRAAFRAEFGLADEDLLLLQIGSGFRIKGVDRTLAALASLPPPLAARTRLMVIGQDDDAPYRRQAAQLGVAGRVRFFKGRTDIPRFLLGADLLIHPAYNENTGNVLLEALAAGLPVLVTGICGFAHYVADADAGVVVSSAPFVQAELDAELARMLSDEPARRHWARNALAFADSADIYDMPERAADVILGRGRG